MKNAQHLRKGLKGCSFAILAIAATLTSQPAFASDWFLVATGESGDRYFMDRASITTSGGTTKVAFFTVYKEVDKGIVGYIEDSEFDCNGNKYRSVRSTYFGDDGSVKRYGVDEKWTTPGKGLVNEILFKEVCSYRP